VSGLVCGPPALLHTAAAVLVWLWLDQAAPHKPIKACMTCKGEHMSSWGGHACTIGTKYIALCHLTGHSSVQARRRCMSRLVAVPQVIRMQGWARRQLYLACFILEHLLLFPACAEFLLQLFNSNLHQDKNIDWLGPGRCTVNKSA